MQQCYKEISRDDQSVSSLYIFLRYPLQNLWSKICVRYRLRPRLAEGFTLDSLLSEVCGKLDTKHFAMPRKPTTQALVDLAGLDTVI